MNRQNTVSNEYGMNNIYQKDKGIEDKQTKVDLNRCQNTHCGKNRTGEGIWLSGEQDYN